MDPLSPFLSHFPDAQPHGGYWTAHCPGHEDRRRSLSISEGDDGRVLINCFAGCPPARILAPLPIDMSDLFPSSPDPSRTEPEAIYDYRDEQGELLYQKVRYPGKRFLIRRPGVNGAAWVTKEVFADGLRRVLYRLPDLLKEERPLVFIVEGEKDCDRLWREELAATANYEGAAEAHQRTKWRDEYSQWLKDHFPQSRFVCLPDNDAAGKSHMQAVAASLTAYGLTATVLELPDLPEKGDVSDWLNQGGTCEGLVSLALPPRPRIRSYGWTELTKLPPPTWQWAGGYEEGTLVLIFGGFGQAKLFVWMDHCYHLARGSVEGPPAWAGRAINRPGGILWLNADGGHGVIKRVNAIQAVYGTELEHYFQTVMQAVHLNNPAHVSELLLLIETFPSPPVMIVWDTLSRSIPGTDENKQGEMTRVTEQCHRLKRETGAVVSLLHHTDKLDLTPRGSQVPLNEADYAFRVSKPQDSRRVTFEWHKARDGERSLPIRMDLCPVPEADSCVMVPPGRMVRARMTLEDGLARVAEIVAEAEAEAFTIGDESFRADGNLIRQRTPGEVPNSTLMRWIKEAADRKMIHSWNRPTEEAPRRYVYGILAESEEEAGDQQSERARNRQ